MGHVTRAERVYCGAVIVSVVGLLAIGPFAKVSGQRVVQLTEFFTLLLCGLFPFGVALELVQARLPVPRLVVLCLILTGLWLGCCIRWNWR